MREGQQHSSMGWGREESEKETSEKERPVKLKDNQERVVSLKQVKKRF